MRKLIIAEKPSVGQSIAKVLGISKKGKGYIENDEYIVSWCIGHLVSLAEPENYSEEYKKWDKLPIIPSQWNYVVKTSTGEQFSILKKLMNDTDVSEVICATDAGREGELIFRHVYAMAGCTKKIKRLWISSLEDSAIKKGFENLKDGDYYENLYQSALCRERADWLVGINATRFFTTLYNSDKALSIGRVQTPTLAMLVRRDNDIKNFVKEKYFTLEMNCGEFFAYTDKIVLEEEAKTLLDGCKIGRAKVIDVTKEEKKINPPKLYDLTTLQRDANRIFGFTAQQTLESVQRLYDSKLLTYPRTDSQYLTEDMEDTAIDVIEILKSITDFTKDTDYNANIKLVMNNKKVSDHHAVIPTVNIVSANLSELMDTDKKILYLTAARLLTATAQEYIYENTVVILKCSNIVFKAKGKTVINKGYRQIDDNFFDFIRYKPEKSTEEEKDLPSIQIGNEYNITSKIVEHYTQPPKNYTEDTLLSAMERAGNSSYDTDNVERKGLGTPATRAGIIETVISRRYAERKNKQLIPTEKGKKLIECVPEKLKSAKLTAEWENRLALIAKGKSNSEEFINDIIDFVKEIVSDSKPLTADISVFSDREVIGKCPRCGSDVYEGKLNFYCSDKNCNFALWKKNYFFQMKKKELTKQVAKKLLSDGKVHFKDLYSEKTGKTYAADVLLDDTGTYVNFKLNFEKKG